MCPMLDFFHLGFVDGIYLKYGGKTLEKDVDKEFSGFVNDVHFSSGYYHRSLVDFAIILRDRILAFLQFLSCHRI